jgi:hypothetical protein
MAESKKERYIRVVSDLIEEGNRVIETKFDIQMIGSPTFVDSQTLHRWWGKVKSLENQLGAAGRPWKRQLSTDPDRNTLAFTKQLLGTLEAIKYEIENDHLASFSKIVHAETLADLLEQAQHLENSGYHLAAGVIGRAILEEHLRAVCTALSCVPSKSRPSINDYNLALYDAQHYSKIKMKQIDALAAIGNDAAHNSPTLNPTDVAKLLADLPEIIDATGA